MSVQTPDQRLEHYRIERELADRLRAATPEQRRSLYAAVYSERSVRIQHHPLVVQAADPEARASAVASQVGLLRPFISPATVFAEVGAGDGAVAKAVAPLVARAIALDVTDALVQPGAPTNFEFRTFDGFDLGLPTESVDVFYSNDVAEHLHADDLLEQTASIRRALRTGGVYVCVTPNRLSGPHDVSRHFDDTPKGFHLREYSVTELVDVFRTTGFSRVRVVATARGRHLSPLMPATAVAPVESALDRMPRRLARRIARPLAAIKVIAVR